MGFAVSRLFVLATVLSFAGAGSLALADDKPHQDAAGPETNPFSFGEQMPTRDSFFSDPGAYLRANEKAIVENPALISDYTKGMSKEQTDALTEWAKNNPDSMASGAVKEALWAANGKPDEPKKEDPKKDPAKPGKDEGYSQKVLDDLLKKYGIKPDGKAPDKDQAQNDKCPGGKCPNPNGSPGQPQNQQCPGGKCPNPGPSQSQNGGGGNGGGGGGGGSSGGGGGSSGGGGGGSAQQPQQVTINNNQGGAGAGAAGAAGTGTTSGTDTGSGNSGSSASGSKSSAGASGSDQLSKLGASPALTVSAPEKLDGASMKLLASVAKPEEKSSSGYSSTESKSASTAPAPLAVSVAPLSLPKSAIANAVSTSNGKSVTTRRVSTSSRSSSYSRKW